MGMGVAVDDLNDYCYWVNAGGKEAVLQGKPNLPALLM